MNQEIEAIVKGLRERVIELRKINNESIPLFRCAAMLDAMEWGPQYGKFPDQKYHRWIGFIQGVLYMTENLNLDSERDRVRKIVVKESGVFSFNSDLVYILSKDRLVVKDNIKDATDYLAKLHNIPNELMTKENLELKENDLKTGGSLYFKNKLLCEIRFR